MNKKIIFIRQPAEAHKKQIQKDLNLYISSMSAKLVSLYHFKKIK